MIHIRSIQAGKLMRNLRIVLMLALAVVVVAPSTTLYAWKDPNDNSAYQTKHPWYNPNDTCGGSAAANGPANLTVGKDFNLGPIDNAPQRQANLVKALMGDFQLSAEQASGIVGNLMHESGTLNLLPDANYGGKRGPPNFNGPYGWAQWLGPRLVNFINFATTGGYMPAGGAATDAANYAWLKNELGTYQAITITEIKKTSTPEDAAVSFEATFERSGGAGVSDRKTKARMAFDSYSSGGAGAGTGTGGGASAGGSSGCGTPGVTADCGDAKACAATILQLEKDGKVVMTPGAHSNLQTIADGSLLAVCNPPGPISLNTTLLQLAIKLIAIRKINIHNFTAPNHGCDYPKFHPRGRAMDIHIEGVPAPGAGGNAENKAFGQQIMDLLPPGGGLGQKQYLGPLNNTAGKRYFDDGGGHFHVDVGKDAPGGGA
jgi:hypothetical protein